MLSRASARASHHQLQEALYGLVIPPDLRLERLERFPLLLNLVLELSQLGEGALQRFLRQSA